LAQQRNFSPPAQPYVPEACWFICLAAHCGSSKSGLASPCFGLEIITNHPSLDLCGLPPTAMLNLTVESAS